MKNIGSLGLIWLAALSVACGNGGRSKVPQTEKVHPEWASNAVMYELNTRQFTPEGTLAAAARELPRLRELGVDVVWLMPVHPIGVAQRKGTLGSYYAISDYKAINPEFGTMDDFKVFVEQAHAQGMKVIMDWVANHTSPDALWAGNRDWYRLDSLGNFLVMFDWTDIAPLDYANRDMREAMIDAMMFWVSETGIDGYRCDVAHEVPVDFWEEAVARLETIRPDIFMLAEAEKPELNRRAFDAYYGWELHHIMNGIARGEKRADTLWTFYKTLQSRFPEGSIPLNFTSNHDENSWNGTEFERMGDAAPTMAALSYLVPGMPLIYNGQEVGFDRRLAFFEKDSIDWNDRGVFGELYRTLGRLKHSSAALASDLGPASFVRVTGDAPRQVFSFVRQAGEDKVLAVFNLSSAEATVRLKLGADAGRWNEYLTGTAVDLEARPSFELAPWEWHVYVNNYQQ
jgi:glycosidase